MAKLRNDDIVQKIENRNASNKAKAATIDSRIQNAKSDLSSFIKDRQEKIIEKQNKINELEQEKIYLAKQIEEDDKLLE